MLPSPMPLPAAPAPTVQAGANPTDPVNISQGGAYLDLSNNTGVHLGYGYSSNNEFFAAVNNLRLITPQIGLYNKAAVAQAAAIATPATTASTGVAPFGFATAAQADAISAAVAALVVANRNIGITA